MAATVLQMTAIGLLALLWATGVYSAPTRVETGIMNSCSTNKFDSNRSEADRLYDAIYIARKLSVSLSHMKII